MASLRRAWTEEDAGGLIDDPGYEARAAAWLAANRSHRLAWLAELDGRAVGFVTVVPLARMPQPGRDDSGWGYVHHFFVELAHRSAGVGRHLIDAVIADARQLGWERLLLHPRDRSRSFYERAGFVTADQWLVRPLA